MSNNMPALEQSASFTERRASSERRRFTERRGTHRSTSLPRSADAPVAYRELSSLPVGRNWLLKLSEVWANPLAIVLSLFAVTAIVHGEILTRHVLLAVAVLILTYRNLMHLTKTIPGIARHIAASWLAISSLLFLLGWVTGALEYFEDQLLIAWWFAAPLSQFAAQLLLRLSKPAIAGLQGPPARAVIVGVNDQGIELAQRMAAPSAHLKLVGFFDDRPNEELESSYQYPLLGKLQDIPRFANDHKIDVIYISLPMYSQPRILALLDALSDTTSSIYFVLDLQITDLVQGRVDTVHGLPVVAVCETPFTGLDGVIKRISDMVCASIILLLVSPLLLLIALGVKLSSPGPVIFRQRRYGLDGKEIVVYKFRTMTVTEDGQSIQQASRQDARVTRFGSFLRKSSLDELPQFVNVLQGRMSVVGPRPHAVAHNEMYRKLINGYMVRHKVRPGITGWAQVNGLRGETEALQKMKERVAYDLDYLRNWSPSFDAYIIAKTIWVVLKGNNAY